MQLQFLKMHGVGNDFVIFDARKQPIAFAPKDIRAIANRRTGVGCDQVIVMEKSSQDGGNVFMRIYNADGSEVSSCGNATRCVAWIIMEETGQDQITIQTHAGVLHCTRVNKDHIRADMGEPKFGWQDIPLSEPRNTLHLGITVGDFSDPVAVSMGNPHAVFIVGDVSTVPVTEIGSELENYPLFPDRANISFAQPLNQRHIKLRVWERGVGETQACGTAACATLVALSRRELVGRQAQIELPGGMLEVEWDKATNHVFMTGPVALSFSGLWNV